VAQGVRRTTRGTNHDGLVNLDDNLPKQNFVVLNQPKLRVPVLHLPTLIVAIITTRFNQRRRSGLVVLADGGSFPYFSPNGYQPRGASTSPHGPQ